jgi:Flp pilus assembly protein TadG
MRMNPRPRRGTATVEFAVIALPTFTILLGLIVGGLGVFRYQEVATLAREAARWASVHGTNYARATGKPAASAQDIFTTMIAGKAVILDPSRLSYNVTWNQSNSPSRIVTSNGQLIKITNTVRVTVNYHWLPETFFGGGAVLTSTSEAAMEF